MTHRSFVSIKWSLIPYNVWLRLCIPNPRECIILTIPGMKAYVLYKAHFVSKYIPDKMVFDMVFPHQMFTKALLTLQPELRQGDRPVQFEFMKTKKDILLRNWVVL